MKTLLALLLSAFAAAAQVLTPPIILGDWAFVPWTQPPNSIGTLEWSFVVSNPPEWHPMDTYSQGSTWAEHTALFPAWFDAVVFRTTFTYIPPAAFAMWPEDAFAP